MPCAAWTPGGTYNTQGGNDMHPADKIVLAACAFGAMALGLIEIFFAR